MARTTKPAKAEAPAPSVKAKTKVSEPSVCWDHNRNTCIALGRDDLMVRYIPLDILGMEVRTMAPQAFDDTYMPAPDYPVERAAKLYAGYATDLGGSEEALAELAKLTTLTELEIQMATAKKAAKPATKTASTEAKPGKVTKRTTAVAKTAAEPAKKAAPARQAKAIDPKAAKAPATGEKKPSAAQMFKDLIMEGKLTDDQIFAKVQKEFGLDDGKRSYVKWYRNDLIKKGEKPPAAKG